MDVQLGCGVGEGGGGRPGRGGGETRRLGGQG